MRLKKKTKKVFVDHHITRIDSVFSLPFIDFVCVAPEIEEGRLMTT